MALARIVLYIMLAWLHYEVREASLYVMRRARAAATEIRSLSGKLRSALQRLYYRLCAFLSHWFSPFATRIGFGPRRTPLMLPESAGLEGSAPCWPTVV